MRMKNNHSLTQAMIKERNKKKIIKSLWQNYPNSRTGLASATKLNKATITNLIGELDREKIIVEVGQQDVGIGRIPTLIMLDKAYGLCAGVALSPNYKITVAISNIYAEILWETTEAYARDLAPFDLLELVSKILKEGISACAHISENLLGIGVSIPKMVRSETGDMFDVQQGELVNVPVADFLRQRFRVPVYADSVANNSLTGEYWFGAAQGYSQSLLLFIGYGIGVSMMIDDKLYHSASGFAGDAGHMSFDPNGLRCPCGKRGCWELTASLLYLDGEEPERVVKKAEGGDGEAIAKLDTIGRSLGTGIANIVNLLNPQVVIVGGDIVRCGKWVINPCQIVLQNSMSPVMRNGFDFKCSDMGRRASIIGALSRVIERLFI